MFEHKKIQKLDDYFVSLEKRNTKEVYFYRINGYSEEIKSFILKYYEAARHCGVIIEGKINNPDQKQLEYYSEIMGMDFHMDLNFMQMSLRKWLPRMNAYQNETVAASIYDLLRKLQQKGKNENMLKNSYIKFMCWLYYKFERIVGQLGENNIPKILYEGDISTYELMLFTVLSKAGCDIVLLQYHGDANYLTLDATSSESDQLQMPGLTDFPETFHLKWIQEQIQRAINNERLYGAKPSLFNCTNAWIEGKGLEDVRKSIQSRGNDNNLFYNCFLRIQGVPDKVTYVNDLYQFQQELLNNKRHVVIVDGEIPQPTMEEIAKVLRSNYKSKEQMLCDLKKNIKYGSNQELERLMNKAFLDVTLEEANDESINLNRLTNRAIYLICWLQRYQQTLFSNWKVNEIACFIYFGACKTSQEALFLRMLSRLPIDVVIINPNLNVTCCVEDSLLYTITYQESMTLEHFPTANHEVHMGTAAYHAERELDTLMYQDSGLYRDYQYKKANAVTLQTTYEEIKILWKEEVKYRPNFSEGSDFVNIPVICAKVSGIQEKDIQKYWSGMKALMTEDTILIKGPSKIEPTSENPMKAYATDFYKNQRVQKKKIKEHPKYPYGVLKEEIQEYMLDKLQVLIDQKTIKGTFENGTEYTIVATVLNLPKEIVRMIQKFDFTKQNPKLIYINTTEKMISFEDSILVAYLNLIGFDIIFFVPTGYETVEKSFNYKIMEEYQVGQYVYDLQVPDFDKISSNTKSSWRDKIFKRGT